MKKLLRKGLTFSVVLCAGLIANAQTYPEIQVVEGIQYKIVGNGEATCLGPEGNHADFKAHNLTLKDYVLFTDSEYPHRVADVATEAFRDCVNITGDLVIPDTYRTILDYAFAGCTGFDGTLTLSSNLRNLRKGAFQGCSGFKGNLVIPDNVQTLYDYIFDGCSGFDGTLTLPTKSDRYIWPGAFRNCSGFTGSLVIPDNIKTIDNYAFHNCLGFDGTLSLSENLETIGDYAFANCSGFKEKLVLPGSVKSVSYHAFENCTGFNALKIEDGVSGLFQYAFANCTGFKGDLILPESLTTLSDHVFLNCSGFDGRLQLSPNVDFINDGAFDGCSGFVGPLVIPEGKLATIRPIVFRGCSGFTSLSLPKTLKEINASAFENCIGLTGSLDLSNITKLGGTVFRNCAGLTGTVTIPEALTTIGYEVFLNCTGIEEFALHDNITDIGFYAFKNTKGKITVNGEVRLPKSLKTTSTETFRDCKGLSGDIILPASLKTIGNRCFYGTNVTGVVIPADVECTVGKGAFAGIESLKWVISLHDTAPAYMDQFTTLNEVLNVSDSYGLNEDLNLFTNYPVYVHSQAVESYRAVLPEYENIFPILAVDNMELELNGTAQVTYKYQPELSEETNKAILALETPHVGSEITWQCRTNNESVASPEPAVVDLGDEGEDSSVVSFDPHTLTVTALKTGSATIEANDGVNIAKATVTVQNPTGVEDITDGTMVEVNGQLFAVSAGAEVLVSVYDIVGQMVYSRVYSAGVAPEDVAGLAPGTYIVTVTSSGRSASAKLSLR